MSQIQQNARIRRSKSKPLSEAALKRKLNEFSNLMPRVRKAIKLGSNALGALGYVGIFFGVGSHDSHVLPVYFRKVII